MIIQACLILSAFALSLEACAAKPRKGLICFVEQALGACSTKQIKPGECR